LMPQLDHWLSSWREIYGKQLWSTHCRLCTRKITAQE